MIKLHELHEPRLPGYLAFCENLTIADIPVLDIVVPSSCYSKVAETENKSKS